MENVAVKAATVTGFVLVFLIGMMMLMPFGLAEEVVINQDNREITLEIELEETTYNGQEEGTMPTYVSVKTTEVEYDLTDAEVEEATTTQLALVLASTVMVAAVGTSLFYIYYKKKRSKFSPEDSRMDTAVARMAAFAIFGVAAFSLIVFVVGDDASGAQYDFQFEYNVYHDQGEAGIESDGYIYTTKWNGNAFFKYELDGTFVEEFTVTGCPVGIRDLAYDGQYFYGSNSSTTVYEIDFSSKTVISTFTAPVAVRAIAYDPTADGGNGGFWANNWSSDITLFKRDGTYISSFTVVGLGSFYGFAWENYSDGDPYLWGYSQQGTNQNTLVKMQLPGGTQLETYDITDSGVTTTQVAGGLCISDAFVSGKWSFCGVVQNTVIWGLELCDVIPENKMHYPQMPDPTGWDVFDSASYSYLADDFKCSETGPITEFTFWGSWYNDDYDEAEIHNIHLSIHEDDRTGPFSKPGTLLWEYNTDVFTVEQVKPDSSQGWYQPFPPNSFYAEDNHIEYFKFNIDLLNIDGFELTDAYSQTKDTIYWLDILIHATNGYWGWKTSTSQYEDFAVFGTEDLQGDVTWQKLEDPITSGHLDMAFVINGPNFAPNAPTDPKCEGQTNPTGVKDLLPEFSWTFSDPNTGDTQGAYQLIVGSTPGGSDMWDSGKKTSSVSNTEYAGLALTLNTMYYWMVKAWDQLGAEGTYCSAQNFTTAAAPTEVWVDDSWAGTKIGDDIDGHIFGYDAFDVIQDGIDTVSNSTVNVAAGTYIEDLTIDKSLSLLGAGSASVTVTGTHTITASIVTVDGFTFDPNGGIGFTVDSSGGALSDIKFENNIFDLTIGHPIGILLGGYNAPNKVSDILMNKNTFNGPTDMISNPWKVGGWYGSPISCEVENVDFTYNTVNRGSIPINMDSDDITDMLIDHNDFRNTDGAIYFWDCAPSGPTGVLSDFVFTYNDVDSTNTYGVGFDPTSPTKFTDINFGTGNMINYNSFDGVPGDYGFNAVSILSTLSTYILDASANWYGTNTAIGVAGEVSANVDYTPWLDVGTDSDAGVGFGPDLSHLHVDDSSPQFGSKGYIEEGIDLVSGSTVEVKAGTYYEDVLITKDLTLQGEGASTTIIQGDPGGTINDGVIKFSPLVTATIDGFTVKGTGPNQDNTGILVDGGASATITNNIIDMYWLNKGVWLAAIGSTLLIDSNTFDGVAQPSLNQWALMVSSFAGNPTVTNNTFQGTGGDGQPLGTGVWGIVWDWSGWSKTGTFTPNTYNTNGMRQIAGFYPGSDAWSDWSITPPISFIGSTFNGCADNFDVEDMIYHELDDANLGYIEWILNEAFVTPNSGSIQRGIDAVTGSTVHVADGTYDEQLVIVKSNLTLVGESNTGTILQPSAAPAPGEYDVEIGQLGGSNVDSVTIENIQFDFNGAGDTRSGNGIVVSDMNGPDVTNIEIFDCVFYSGHANTCIQTGLNAAVGGLNVHDNTFHGDADGMGEGVYINPRTDTPTVVTIKDNTFDGYLYSGISIESGYVTATGNTINSNTTKGVYGVRVIEFYGTATHDNIIITYNDIDNLQYGVGVGMSTSKGSTLAADIEYNDINNCDVGIRVRNDADLDSSVHYNDLSGNTNYGIKVESTSDVDATENWWGSDDWETIEGYVYHHVDDKSLGVVDYAPWYEDNTMTGTSLPDIVWVDDNYTQAGNNQMGSQDPAWWPAQTGNYYAAWGVNAFDTIQDGIDNVSGSTVHVMDGTYAEDFTVDKSLNLLGPNSAISPNTGGGRVAEAIVEIASGPLGSFVTADTVTIKGFMFKAPASYTSAGTLLLIDQADNVTIEKNKFVTTWSTTTGSGISCLWSDRASGMTITDNRFETDGGALGGNADAGMDLYGGGNSGNHNTISDNTLIHDLKGGGYGLAISASPNGDASYYDVTGNNFSTYNSGIQLVDSYPASVGFGVSHIIITENTIQNGKIGIWFYATAETTGISNVTVGNSSNIITGNEVGIKFQASADAIDFTTITVNYNDISGNTNYGIENLNTRTVDAEYNWWGHATGPYDNKGLPGTPDYNNPLGQGNEVTSYVDYQPYYATSTTTSATENVEVSYNPVRCYSDTIQGGIDAAYDGDTITVIVDGTYPEDLVVNTANLTLKSTNGKSSTTINLQDGVGIDIQGLADNFVIGGVVNKGFTINGGASTTFLIQLTNAPSNVEISYNDFDSTVGGSQIISVGAAGASGLDVHHNSFSLGSGDIGIWAPFVSDISFDDNEFTGGAVAIEPCGVTGTSTISRNTITDADGAGGIVLLNGDGTSGLTVSENNISNCDSYGIALREYSPGANGMMTTVSIIDNTISNNGVGIGIYASTWLDPTQFSINHNSITANTTYALDNQHSANVDATENWWGSNDWQTIEGVINHHPDDYTLGAVDYAPWWTTDGGPGIEYPNIVWVDDGYTPTADNLMDEHEPSWWPVQAAAYYGAWHVNAFDTIQEAIDNVTDNNGLIIVRDGTYVEDLLIPSTKTNLEIRNATGATPTIKGVQMANSFPLAGPNIDIWGAGTSIHGFIIQGPDMTSGKYSSGMVIGATGVEIYENDFQVTSATTGGEVSQGIQTYRTHDISDLHIHDNTFTHHGTGSWGYEGIYVNEGPGTGVTIEDNTLTGDIIRGITTEHDHTIIDDNCISTDLVPVASDWSSGGAYQGILVYNYALNPQDDITVTCNTIKGSTDWPSGSGFKEGLRVGKTGQTITNITVTGNTFENNYPVQVIDFSDVLDIQDVLDDNTFDRAVVIDSPGASLLPVIYSSIMHAVENDVYTDLDGIDGDTIYVYPGTYHTNILYGPDIGPNSYYEEIDVRESLVIESVCGPLFTKIDGNYGGSGIDCRLDNKDVIIDGFWIYHCLNGISGMYLINNSSLTIINNWIKNNTGPGILVIESTIDNSTLTVEDNYICENEYGIVLHNVINGSTVTIEDNKINNNGLVSCDGIHISGASDSTISIYENEINNNNEDGIEIFEAYDCLIEIMGNEISNNGYDGITIIDAWDCTIDIFDNEIHDNGWDGIMIYWYIEDFIKMENGESGGEITIWDNDIYRNYDDGIDIYTHLLYSDNLDETVDKTNGGTLTIEDNCIVENTGTGIVLYELPPWLFYELLIQGCIVDRNGDPYGYEGINIYAYMVQNLIIDDTDINEPIYGLAGSCPFLYSWNGEEFEFVNELNPGIMGMVDVRGVRINKDKWENDPFYVTPNTPINEDFHQKIESDQIQPLNGKYEIRYTEELDELNYTDLLELWTIDHAPGVEVYPDWTLMDNIYTVTDPFLPISAVDHNGNNVLDLISARDWDEWISEWRELEYEGMPPVSEVIKNNYGGYITLKLGDWAQTPENLKLVITENKELRGNELILEQFSEMLNEYQKLKLQEILSGPKLQIKNPQGTWVDAPYKYQKIQLASQELPVNKRINSSAMAFNMPSSFVIDLSGLNIPDYEIRYFVQNPILRHHVDQILVDTSAPQDVTLTKLTPSSADLQYRGSSQQGQVLLSRRINEWNSGYDYYDGFFDIDYNDVFETSPIQTGNYTRFGDVLPLVQAIDDEFVVMGKGDELSLQFDYTEPTIGLERDFIFRVFGYYKPEGNAYNDTVDPLPFKDMTMYPYDETVENYDYEAHADYINDYQTRNVEGHHSAFGIYLEYVDDFLINDVRGVPENILDDEYGIYLYNCTDGTITNSVLTDGWEYAIYIYNDDSNLIDTLQYGEFNLDIHYNDLSDNYYGIYNDYYYYLLKDGDMEETNGYPFDEYFIANATYNWWGDSSGPYDGKMLPGIPDYYNPYGLGSDVSSYVHYWPWLKDWGIIRNL